MRDEGVELSSGDRVTGEIKGLDRSYLTVRTIDLGTVQIRWQRVGGQFLLAAGPTIASPDAVRVGGSG